MAKNKRKLKEDFWMVAVVVAIIIVALISSWWKENAVIGWVIVGLVIVVFGYSLYRFPSLRNFIFRTAKTTGKNIIFEEEASSREPVPSGTRQHVLARANNRCENQDCKQVVKPHIHHIDANNSNNNPKNLIALCPNCHTKAHGGIYTTSQLRNWSNYSWARYTRNQRNRR
ncbi:HNH endonuclease [Chloroflexota bacterium]